MSWLWNMFQQLQINDTLKRSSDARFDAKDALQAISDLEDKVARLSLLCHALFEELERTTGLSEAQLKEKMIEIDMRDGKLDGKYDPTSNQKCPDCGHQLRRNRPNCFWCGSPLTTLTDSGKQT